MVFVTAQMMVPARLIDEKFGGDLQAVRRSFTDMASDELGTVPSIAFRGTGKEIIEHMLKDANLLVDFTLQGQFPEISVDEFIRMKYDL